MHAIVHVDDAGLVLVENVELDLAVVTAKGVVVGTLTQNEVSSHKPPQFELTDGFHARNCVSVKVPYFLTTVSQFSSLTTKWNLLHVSIIPSRTGLGFLCRLLLRRR
jgi:hypothetical protein